MRVDRIDWPDDMTDIEAGSAARLEPRVRVIVETVPHDTDEVFRVLDQQLFARSVSVLAGRVRIVIAAVDGAPDAVEVRFRWTKYEREARDAKKKADAARAAIERSRHAAAYQEVAINAADKCLAELRAALEHASASAEQHGNPAALDAWELALQFLEPLANAVARAHRAAEGGN